MLVICLRALILYVVVLIVTRLMGKRELGEMQPFELVISMLLANLASGPMAHIGVPLYTGGLAILACLIGQILFAVIIQKSAHIRNLVCGQPLVLIYKGQVNLDAMRRTHYTFADLMSQLRSSNIFDAAKVDYAILETDGKLSILEKASSPDTENPDGLPHLLILDGKVQTRSLALSGYDIRWLNNQLISQGYRRPKDVAYASVDKLGQLAIMPIVADAQARVRP